MKICAYVQWAYSKTAYKNECMDTRQFVGLRVVIDCLERVGYQVDYAGIATVHEYDVVLVSLTSDCDWWSYITERLCWHRGRYKVLIGGAGCLHIAPFLPWFYAAMFGRGRILSFPLCGGSRADTGMSTRASAMRTPSGWMVSGGLPRQTTPITGRSGWAKPVILLRVPLAATTSVCSAATPGIADSYPKRNYRGEVGRVLGPGLRGNLIYQGRSLWAVESMGTESLSTVMLSAIAHRGGVEDCENIARLCSTSKFWRASAAIKEATLCKYFDMDTLFGAFTPATLPSRYLRTYAGVERMWGKTPLEGGGNCSAGTEAADGCGKGQRAEAPEPG